MVPYPPGIFFSLSMNVVSYRVKIGKHLANRRARSKGGTKIVAKRKQYCINMISVILYCNVHRQLIQLHMKHEQLAFFLHRRGTKCLTRGYSRKSVLPVQILKESNKHLSYMQATNAWSFKSKMSTECRMLISLNCSSILQSERLTFQKLLFD